MDKTARIIIYMLQMIAWKVLTKAEYQGMMDEIDKVVNEKTLAEKRAAGRPKKAANEG